jgi:hypothetical protein
MDRSTKRMTRSGALIGGVLGSAAVCIGNVNHVSGFCQDTGFLGTHLLNPGLYGMGNDLFALWIVALVWFANGAVALGLLEFLLGRVVAMRKRSGSS